MANLEIDNQKEFYEGVSVRENGSAKIELTVQQGAEVKPLTAFEFYKTIALNENGGIKIFI